MTRFGRFVLAFVSGVVAGYVIRSTGSKIEAYAD